MALVERLRFHSGDSPNLSPLIANLRPQAAFPLESLAFFRADEAFDFFDPNIVVQEANFRAYMQSHKYKTEICRNFELGRPCRWGSQCCFAHGKEELRSRAPFSHFYKTKICKHFHNFGLCPYGVRCQYFHFRSHQVYSELLDSMEKKVMLKLSDGASEDLSILLLKSERLQPRLPIFKKLCEDKSEEKSVYEKFTGKLY